MTIYQFQFRQYQRQFKHPLSTSHGIWEMREGIILRLTNEIGQISWGEIAPIPWFGSETLAEALNFCFQLGDKITTESIFSIPSQLPACQFGFESALNFESSTPPLLSSTPPLLRGVRGGSNLELSKITYSALLPTGEAALEQWQPLWQQGYRTFKWKIGVLPIKEELNIFQQLIQTLPTEAKLRLDANGGLTWEEANEWLKHCDPFEIEFIEQPLPINQFHAMLELTNRYSTPLALDESVATINQLQKCHQQGWRSIFVIKPCIAGSPKLLRHFCQQNQIDAVFSSVFETTIGRQAALNLAAEISNPNRAVGFGINHWFDEDETWLLNLWNNL